jgi:DNA polymerase III delta prime subunit
MNFNNSVPWMEKYRPIEFDQIVLDPINKQILQNVIEQSHFPNLLFYGPPGTGKTTTIINLINAYQTKIGSRNKDLIIHLNASDERGIDIIRNQISVFVNSKALFRGGMKFVILDEVDYMTKNAQQALRYLLQNFSNNVRFCLICNYISKIDEGLQNEFIRLRFNQLPKADIVLFLKNISKAEKLNMSDESIISIQNLYRSDIRSMINFMQSNQDIDVEVNIIDNSVWDGLSEQLSNKDNAIDKLVLNVYDISLKFNIDKKNIIKDYINYIIRNKPNVVTTEFLNFVENLLHSQETNNQIFIYYSLSRLSNFICS